MFARFSNNRKAKREGHSTRDRPVHHRRRRRHSLLHGELIGIFPDRPPAAIGANRDVKRRRPGINFPPQSGPHV